MKFTLLLLLLSSFYLLYANDSNNGCLQCHSGIESIRDRDSTMMKEILEISKKASYEGNDCIVCHGGNPSIKYTKKLAHKGSVKYFKKHEGPKAFYPSPTSPKVNKNTCGLCHKEQVEVQKHSIMATGAGTIHEALWSFGVRNSEKHNIANYDINSSGMHKGVGTKEYQAYMSRLKMELPDIFVDSMKELRKAPTISQIDNDPQLSAYTYLRQNLQRPMKSVEYRHRGEGCAACHIPFGSSGHYEGDDKSISKKSTGHLLVHSIHSGSKSRVKVHNGEYSGVPVASCSSCHSNAKGVANSYQGLMNMDNSSAYNSGYMHLSSDIHMQKGMLCQDCHTSLDMHGNGMLIGASLANVEIECQDCHGTTTAYPWELPLGFSDEYGVNIKKREARGTTKILADYLKKANPNPSKKGYILSARGNPFGNVVRENENMVRVYLASGKSILLNPLKKLKEEDRLSREALIAMDSIASHADKLECYSCHAAWAPQRYGQHIKADYSLRNSGVDRLAKSVNRADAYSAGKVNISSSYIRWEEPFLINSGEGRVSPAIPLNQTALSVVSADGEILIEDYIFKTPNRKSSATKGQLVATIGAVAPHTTSKSSRSCESCHSSKKAIGMGIEGTANVVKSNNTLNLRTADGKSLSHRDEAYLSSVSNLEYDWSRFINDSGDAIQSVGVHYPLSGVLSAEQIKRLDMRGSCLSCHSVIPNGDIAVNLLSHVGEVIGLDVDKSAHGFLVRSLMQMSAWLQIVGGGFIFALILYKIIIRKKERRW